ncbi:MAG: hypothetical protein ACOCVR_03485, partial [Myxococcota bacterium]
ACIHDVARSESFLDYGHRAAYLAFGSVVENIHLAAMQMGFDLEVLLFPDASDPVRVCDLVFKERHDAPEDTDLFQQIPHRVTNRKLGPRVPLETSDAEALLRTAEGRGARLQLAADPELLTMGGDMLGRGDRIRFLSSIMHPEMMSEIRWSTEEAAATRDGLDVATLELSPTDLAGMRLTSAWRVMDLVGRVGGGRALEKPSRKAVAAASALGLVTAPEDSPEGFFTGGRAAQRVWLAATARGLAFQPMTAITYLWLRLAYEPETLSRSEQAELRELREVYRKLFEVPEGCAEAMLFRLARAEPPTARALRRRVEDVLAFMENSPQDEA